MTHPSPADSPLSPGAWRRGELLGCTLGGALFGVIQGTNDASSFQYKLALLAERGTPAQEVSAVVLRELALPSLLFLVACLGPVLVWSMALWRRPGWRESMWKGLVSFAAVIAPFWLASSILIKLLLWKGGGSIEGWLAVGLGGTLAAALGGLGGFLWGSLFAKQEPVALGEPRKEG
jgi:hypothetical protein